MLSIVNLRIMLGKWILPEPMDPNTIFGFEKLWKIADLYDPMLV